MEMLIFNVVKYKWSLSLWFFCFIYEKSYIKVFNNYIFLGLIIFFFI